MIKYNNLNVNEVMYCFYPIVPKGIYRRNIGDYLREPYLWLKYR